MSVEFCNLVGDPPYQLGSPTIDLPLALLKGIDNASRNGNADFGLITSLTYISVNNDVQILTPPRKSIKTDTSLVGAIDNRTSLIKLTLAFGTLPLPGQNPSFGLTIQVVHRD